ncbi:PP2C family protein-serine/threonine phosphatase [Thaumasiovibrio sp. DFM-14]|uniref:PP2C family protein-serine/threonine phosphatase n=1 Tax=Thaumasiovibrio sp. DFM-14 TaxID=3384792 RepID=UPI0039A00329
MKMSDWQFFSFVKSHAGKVRPYNEDCCTEMLSHRVWVVADGMGGHKAGDIASQMLVDTVRKVVDETQDLNIDHLKDAIVKANQAIYQYAADYLEGSTMGTTAVVLFIDAGQYHCLWVGDSRFYRLRKGQFEQKSRDHSQVTEMVDQGLILASEAENHPMANVITRAVGVLPQVVVDQVSGQLCSDDQFILCTDGLTKELTNQEIAFCLEAQTVNQSGLALMHSALVKGATDNVTCAVVKASYLGQWKESQDRNDATVPVFSGLGRKGYDI